MSDTLDRITETVLHAVSRRRRKRSALFGGVAVLAAITVGVALVGGGGGTKHPTVQAARGLRVAARLDGAIQLVAQNIPTPPADRAAMAQVVQGQQQLAITLLQKLGGHGNASISPASLDLALGMLQNGARGATERQIAAVLGTSHLTTAQQNAGHAQLTAELATAAKASGITLQSANSLWQQKGFPLRRQFMAALATYYRTGVWQTDFSTPAAARAINAWTAQATHGKITKLFDQLSADTVLVLADAVFFHADWATPFDRHATEPGVFTTGAGQHVQARFMSGALGLKGVSTTNYSAAELPYQGGRFAALAIMPTSGTLAGLTSTLTPAELTTIAGSVTPGVGVMMPRFTTTSTTDLKPVLTSLGMTDAFGNADLSGLSRQPTQVDQVTQRVYLGVGETGTTAAAVTGEAIASAAVVVNQTIDFDHPFLFLIRDTTTGAILFASEIDNPTAG